MPFIKLEFKITGVGRVSHPFNSVKTMTQYIRRSKLKNYEIYANDKRVVFLNKKLIDLTTAVMKVQELQTPFSTSP